MTCLNTCRSWKDFWPPRTPFLISYFEIKKGYFSKWIPFFRYQKVYLRYHWRELVDNYFGDLGSKVKMRQFLDQHAVAFERHNAVLNQWLLIGLFSRIVHSIYSFLDQKLYNYSIFSSLINIFSTVTFHWIIQIVEIQSVLLEQGVLVFLELFHVITYLRNLEYS